MEQILKGGSALTWEIAMGFLSLLSSFLAVINVVVRVNKTLASLEVTVRNLQHCMEKEDAHGEEVDSRLNAHEVRLTVLENAPALRGEESPNDRGHKGR